MIIVLWCIFFTINPILAIIVGSWMISPVLGIPVTIIMLVLVAIRD